MLKCDLKALLEKNNNVSKYSLVIACAKRAREIAEDAEAKGERLIEKPVTLSINELFADKYKIVETEE